MVLTYQLDIHEESLLLHPNSLGSTEISLGILKLLSITMKILNAYQIHGTAAGNSQTHH